MTRTLVLPRLVAGRDFANDMVRRNLGSIVDSDVTVDASLLVSGTPSFAAQLVRSIVTDGQASSLVVAGGPDSFATYVLDAARSLVVLDKVRITPTLSGLGAAS